jgi:hypothetical protein
VERRSAGRRIITAALLGLGVLAVLGAAAVAGLAWLSSGFTTEWERPAPPTSSAIARLREAAPSPTYWFGPRTDAPLSVADPIDGVPGSRIFIYGQFCEELDPGSGLTCTDHGVVVNEPRRIGAGTFVTRDASCWHRAGAAWVVWCRDSWRANLWTADRVVEFSKPQRGDPAVVDPTTDRRPWQETIRELQRFDAGARGPRITATTRLTCAERLKLGRRQRAALPEPLRARGC